MRIFTVYIQLRTFSMRVFCLFMCGYTLQHTFILFLDVDGPVLPPPPLQRKTYASRLATEAPEARFAFLCGVRMGAG